MRQRGRTPRPAAALIHVPPGCLAARRPAAPACSYFFLWTARSAPTARLCAQIVGVLRGRPSADAPGAGHCDVVLSVDASTAPDLPFIASCGHQGDGSIQVWAHESWAAGEAEGRGAAAMDTS